MVSTATMFVSPIVLAPADGGFLQKVHKCRSRNATSIILSNVSLPPYMSGRRPRHLSLPTDPCNRPEWAPILSEVKRLLMCK